MEGILHTFGIDTRLIVIQIINFAILAAALWYFLYTPVLNLLRDREERIKKGVADADAAATKLSEAEKERSAIITVAHAEAEDIAGRAKEHAKEKAAAILHEAQQKAEHHTKDAELKGEDIKARARKESEEEIARLAILTAEKVLRERSP